LIEHQPALLRCDVEEPRSLMNRERESRYFAKLADDSPDERGLKGSYRIESTSRSRDRRGDVVVVAVENCLRKRSLR
jgi:hypothetical protein